MTLNEAIANIRSMPEIRRAVLVIFDETIVALEQRLLTVTTTDEKAIVYARQRLDGAVSARAHAVKLLAMPQRDRDPELS